MCLMGVLAGETAALPPRIAAEVSEFFDRNRRWLETVLARSAPKARPQEIADKALLVAATLEGEPLMAHGQRDRNVFERAVNALADTLVISSSG